jgi:group I intron endonuclease
MEKFIVYKITNTINGKMYFGITRTSIKKRWTQHKCNAIRKPYYLYRSIIKYGIEFFTISVVKFCSNEKEMYDLEKRCISQHKTNNRKYGYNHSTGGEISSIGRTLSVETKSKISNYQKSRKRKPHSEETIKKMREKAKGRKVCRKAIENSAKKRKGKKAHNTKKVILNDNFIYNSITEASDATGVSVTSISNNINGLSKTTKKGVWKIC